MYVCMADGRRTMADGQRTDGGRTADARRTDGGQTYPGDMTPPSLTASKLAIASRWVASEISLTDL